MESSKIKYHSTLARYFKNQGRYLAEEKTKPNTRKLVEQPWQQTKAELWDDVTKTLCDLLFIEAKIVNRMTYELIDDYNTVLKVLPEAREENKKEEEHQARVKKYTDDMIEYASKWNEARKRNREDPEKFPMPKDEDIPLPELIQSVEPWSDEKRKKETERIINNPTRLNNIRAYLQFVLSENSTLRKYGTHPGFVIQHAYNNADYPAILEGAKEEVNKDNKNVLLVQKFRKPVYDPFPALLNTLEEHTAWVKSVAITPDGKRAVSGSHDNTLRVWDLESGACLKVLEEHTDWVESVAITPDGKRAVSGSHEKTLRVWDLVSGACLKILEGHTNYIVFVAITPDGKRAVSGSSGPYLRIDHELRLWDLESGECLKVLEGHTRSVNSVAITPDGKRAVSGSEDWTLRLWDLESGAGLKVLEGHTSWVNSVAITPDGKMAVSSGSRDKTLRLWDLESGECLKVLEGHTDYVYSVVITSDGKRAVSGSDDHTLRLWDLESGACLKVLEGHTSTVFSVAITPDGKRAISGGGGLDKTLRLWDLERGACLKVLEGHAEWVESVVITLDGKRAVSGSHDNTLRVWDLESGACLKVLEEHTDWVESVAITPDGKRVVSGSDDHTLRLWDLESGACLKVLEGHAYGVKSVAITPDEKMAVSSGSWDHTLRLWDLESGGCLKVFEGHTQEVSIAAITPDGKRAVSGDSDSLLLWDLESGACLKVLEGHEYGVESVVITLDGKRAVSGSHDNTLRVWDLESGACLKVLEEHTAWVESVAITPDGKRVVSGSRDSTLRLWDLESGACLKVFEGHADWVNSVAITPDGKRAVSGSRDSTLRLWDLESGACISVFKTNSNVSSVAYSNHPNSVIAGEQNGSILILQPLHMIPDIPKVTLQRLWLFDDSNEKGNWDENITAVCEYCGERFNVQEKYISLIRSINKEAGITPEMSPCLSLPDEAFENPGLLSECPNCKKPIKFNPFIVDNRDNKSYNKRFKKVKKVDLKTPRRLKTPKNLENEALNLNILACEQREEGNFEEAERNFRTALDYDIRARGKNHPKIAHRLNNLSVVLVRTGRFSEGKKNLKRAWKILNFNNDITGFRILFMRLCIALLNKESSNLYLGQIKTMLTSKGIENSAEAGEPWSINEFISYICNELSKDKAQLLQTIFNVHNAKQNLKALNKLSLWSNQVPKSLKTKWRD